MFTNNKKTNTSWPSYYYVLPILVAILVYFGFSVWKNQTEYDDVHLTASKLQYNPAMEIGQAQGCFDVFSHCYVFLYYRTDQTREDLENSIQSLDWKILDAHDIDGYVIFTHINYDSRYRLTLNGSELNGDRTNLPQFKGYKWRLKDHSGKYWGVEYFPLASQFGIFAIDGSETKNNIVVIMRQTR